MRTVPVVSNAVIYADKASPLAITPGGLLTVVKGYGADISGVKVTRCCLVITVGNVDVRFAEMLLPKNNVQNGLKTKVPCFVDSATGPTAADTDATLGIA